jgi:hypothetical protein
MKGSAEQKAKIAAGLREVLLGKYPELRVVLERETIYLSGSFPVVHEGEILDRFQIAISLPHDFPRSIPVLRETGGRIPRVKDRHINPESGEACPIVPEEWLLLPIEQRTVMAFLDGPVRNFFIGQALVERGLPWPYGERNHGRPGLIQSYGEMLGITDEAAIPDYLDCLSHQRIKGHWNCPCGSGRRLRDCHIKDLKTLQRRIPRLVAQAAFDRLRGLLK